MSTFRPPFKLLDRSGRESEVLDLASERNGGGPEHASTNLGGCDRGRARGRDAADHHRRRGGATGQRERPAQPRGDRRPWTRRPRAGREPGQPAARRRRRQRLPQRRVRPPRELRRRGHLGHGPPQGARSLPEPAVPAQPLRFWGLRPLERQHRLRVGPERLHHLLRQDRAPAAARERRRRRAGRLHPRGPVHRRWPHLCDRGGHHHRRARRPALLPAAQADRRPPSGGRPGLRRLLGRGDPPGAWSWRRPGRPRPPPGAHVGVERRREHLLHSGRRQPAPAQRQPDLRRAGPRDVDARRRPGWHRLVRLAQP